MQLELEMCHIYIVDRDIYYNTFEFDLRQVFEIGLGPQMPHAIIFFFFITRAWPEKIKHDVNGSEIMTKIMLALPIIRVATT